MNRYNFIEHLEGWQMKRMGTDKQFNFEPTVEEVLKMRNRTIRLAITVYAAIYGAAFVLSRFELSYNMAAIVLGLLVGVPVYVGYLLDIYRKKIEELVDRYNLKTDEFDLTASLRAAFIAALIGELPFLMILFPIALISFMPMYVFEGFGFIFIDW